MKKNYVKPEIRMISVSPEERLATCKYVNLSELVADDCNDVFYPVDSPSTCHYMIVPNGLS